MQAQILGSTLPVVELTLEGNDKIISANGQLSWMTGDVKLETKAATAGSSGLMGAFKRALSGGSFFMTEFSTPSGKGMVAFAAHIPGEILEIDLHDTGYMIHQRGFLCATDDIALTTGFQQNIGAGIFGGNGFMMQKASGNGKMWVELGGEVVTYTLAAGESIQVHPGHVGMYEGSVTCDITTIKGIKNMFFGGDGLFLARLTGPGKVWLQSLTLPNLAHALEPYLPKVSDNASAGAAGGVAGAVVKGLFK